MIFLKMKESNMEKLFKVTYEYWCREGSLCKDSILISTSSNPLTEITERVRDIDPEIEFTILEIIPVDKELNRYFFVTYCYTTERHSGVASCHVMREDGKYLNIKDFREAQGEYVKSQLDLENPAKIVIQNIIELSKQDYIDSREGSEND